MTKTQVPWLCDTMDDAATKAFGETYNGEFVLDPDGEIIRQRFWSNPKTLRSDLIKFVGPVTKRTRIQDLPVRFRPQPRKIASGIIEPITLPRGLVPVQLKYAPKDNQPLYVKLRAEMTSEPVDGRYQMYLGFYVDPIYKTHWNNAAGPVRVDIKSPEKMRCDDRVLYGPNVEAAADVDPRMFLLNFSSKGDYAPIKLKLHYVICDDAETFCQPTTQHFEVTPVPLNNGSTRPSIFLDQAFRNVAKFDKNHDGKISRRELPKCYASLYMLHIDYNLDNVIEPDELKRFKGMYNNGRGIGHY